MHTQFATVLFDDDPVISDVFFFFFFNDTATTEIYTLHIVGSVRCVQETVIKQSQPPFHCNPFDLRSRGPSIYQGAPYPEVTVQICRVPSPEFSQAPQNSHPAHLCRFAVRSLCN
eukprot:TRINITY_DN311_c0_g1_i4.p2 TRINITY_DN311_c0_g1~~TRINITY_DN311_c0_g1_i4.p2  ORF type:complete len:115 (+),score=10.21 TRINITY_DN311_c0_g1_i4:57-401(+)